MLFAYEISSGNESGTTYFFAFSTKEASAQADASFKSTFILPSHLNFGLPPGVASSTVIPPAWRIVWHLSLLKICQNQPKHCYLSLALIVATPIIF